MLTRGGREEEGREMGSMGQWMHCYVYSGGVCSVPLHNGMTVVTPGDIYFRKVVTIKT